MQTPLRGRARRGCGSATWCGCGTRRRASCASGSTRCTWCGVARWWTRCRRTAARASASCRTAERQRRLGGGGFECRGGIAGAVHLRALFIGGPRRPEVDRDRRSLPTQRIAVRRRYRRRASRRYRRSVRTPRPRRHRHVLHARTPYTNARPFTADPPRARTPCPRALRLHPVRIPRALCPGSCSPQRDAPAASAPRRPRPTQ